MRVQSPETPKAWRLKPVLHRSPQGGIRDSKQYPKANPFKSPRRAAIWLAIFSLFLGHAAAQNDWPTLALNQLVSGTNQPTQITNAHDGSGRIFVVEQAGRIRIIQSGAFLSAPFLDISSKVLLGGANGEEGMLSVAFPPSYATVGHFYASYTRAPDQATVISRFSLTTNANVADPTTEQVILAIPQPFANHKSGQLVFGPDGFLYIGVGDGGSEGDPNNEGQTTSTLLGKLLRVDTESGVTPYAIPPSNPFVNNPAFRPEIWALGLRNPWRFSFDRQTGDLYIADVGQSSWEEIDIQPAGSAGGQNYGWRIMEGFSDYDVPPGFDLSTLTLPAIAYPHDSTGGYAVIGGYAYRGPSVARMNGLYICGDYLGYIWGMKNIGGAGQLQRLLTYAVEELSTFGEDEAGNLYAADYDLGIIYSLTDTLATNTPTASPPAETLNAPTYVQLVSDTGATIYYTLNGTTPTTSSPSVLSGSTVLLSPGAQLKAFAVKAGFATSAITSVAYTFQAGTPQLTPAGGPLTQPTLLSMSTTTPGATIHYTTDGSMPTATSPVYSAPFMVDPPETVQAIAMQSGYTASTAASSFFGLLIQESTTVTTIAGGQQGYVDGPVAGAKFFNPRGLCLDSSGVLYVADESNNAIRTITPGGQVGTLAGGTSGFVNGLGAAAKFDGPEGICVDSSGNLFVTDVFNYAIRQVSPSGLVTTVASGANSGFGNMGIGIFINLSGTLCLASFGRIEILSGSTATVFAGPGAGNVYTGWQVDPGIALAPGGQFYVSSTAAGLSTVSSAGTIATLAGSSSTPGFSDGPAATARFEGAGAMCCDLLGNLYLCDSCCVRKITPNGVVSSLAGGLRYGFADGPGATATFGYLYGICVNPLGVVFVSDSNNAIRQIAQSNPYPSFNASAIMLSGHAGLQLSWPTVAGVNYQAQYSNDLTNWQNVGAPVLGDGTVKSATDPAVSGVAQRFYRLSVVPP